MSVVKSRKSAEEAAAQVRSSVEDQVRFGSEAAQRGFEQAASITREQFDKASKTMFKSYEEFSQLSKENIDAFVKSGTIVARASRKPANRGLTSPRAPSRPALRPPRPFSAARICARSWIFSPTTLAPASTAW